MVIILLAEDAPGKSCDEGETSAQTPVNLRMVDDTGFVMEDGAKTVVCKAGQTTNLERDVFWQGKENCKDSAVPDGSFSDGDVTATVSIAGQPDYVEVLNAKCFE